MYKLLTKKHIGVKYGYGKDFYKRILLRSIHCYACAYPIDEAEKECPGCGMKKILR